MWGGGWRGQAGLLTSFSKRNADEIKTNLTIRNRRQILTRRLGPNPKKERKRKRKREENLFFSTLSGEDFGAETLRTTMYVLPKAEAVPEG